MVPVYVMQHGEQKSCMFAVGEADALVFLGCLSGASLLEVKHGHLFVMAKGVRLLHDKHAAVLVCCSGKCVPVCLH